MRLEGQQLARALEGGRHAVPQPGERPRELPAPLLLGVKRRQRVPAAEREIGHEQEQAGGEEREPQRIAPNAVARGERHGETAQTRELALRRAREVRRAVLARAVQVEDEHGEQQQQARAARRAGERPERAREREAAVARGVEDAYREREVQRLGVDRGEK